MSGAQRPRRRRILLAAAMAVVLFGAAQLVPVRRTNPPVVSEPVVGPELASVLRRSCFDCHSNETRWPWYSRVAPVSWWLVHHVDEGRSHLNFSTWPTFDFQEQDHLLDEIADEVSKGDMPLATYLVGHPAARLDAGARQLILDWARGG